MKRHVSFILLYTFYALSCTVSIAHATVPDITITDNTAPEIREKYNALISARQKRTAIQDKYISALSDNAQKMLDNENSLINKTIGAAGIGAVGIGGSMVGAALSERAADDDAERAMRAYLNTFKCEYGDGKQINGGEVNVELPGGNDMFELYTEYATLANDLKVRKEALGLRPGIESEVSIDKSETGLYDDVGTGITGGAYASIARALQNPDGEDAKMWAAMRAATDSKLKTGAIVAGAGAAASLAANIAVNKDAPKENSAQIKTQYESELAATDAEIQNAESELESVIANNENAINQYNENLANQQQIATAMNGGAEQTCYNHFAEQINTVLAIQPIGDPHASVASAPAIPDMAADKILYDSCIMCRYQMLGEYYIETDECACRDGDTMINNMCVSDIEIEDSPIGFIDDELRFDDDGKLVVGALTTNGANSEVSGSDSTDVAAAAVAGAATATETDPNQCPADNPRLKTLNETYRVGDFCSYGNVSQGKVFKYKTGANAGTCSCTATACESGYKLEKGRCVEEENAAATITNPTTTENEKPKLEFKHVCKDKSKNPKCIDTFKKLWVLPMQAVGIAMEYARVKLRKNIACDDNNIDKLNSTFTGNSSAGATLLTSQIAHYLACTTTDGKEFYDFVFKSTDETGDNTIRKSASEAICMIHGVKAHPDSKGGCSYKDQTRSKTNGPKEIASCWGAYCETSDTQKCNQINSTANRFGYSARLLANKCYISFNDVKNVYGSGGENYVLKTAFGIDNKQFCMGDIQVKGSTAIINMLEEYTTKNANTTITSFKCAGSPRQYRPAICGGGLTDDIITCTANGQEIDYVFDDISESWNSTAKGGQQGMSCIVGGGRFSGKRCIGLGKDMCDKLTAANLTDCPECKAAHWDTETESCLLPSSMKAAKIQKGIDISVIVGGAVVAAAVTVATGGTGGALILVGIETAGAGLEIYEQGKINKIADNFLIESNKCKEASCAKELLKQNFQHVARTNNDFTDAEIKVIDAEFARLIELLDDKDFYTDLLNAYDTNHDGTLNLDDDKGWTSEQVWRAVGIAMQFATMGATVANKLISKSTRATRAMNALKTKINKLRSSGDVYWDASAKRWRSKSTGRFARNPNATTAASSSGGTTGASAGRTATATTGATTRGTANAETVLNSAKAKLAEGGESFDEIFTKVKQGGSYPASWKTSSLSADELAALNKQLEADGYKLIDDGTGYLKFEKTTTPASTGAATGTRAGATAEQSTAATEARKAEEAAAKAASTKAPEISIGRQQATERIEREMRFAAQNGLSESNERILDIQMQYLEDASKATTKEESLRAYLTYHQRIVDYTSSLFNRSKAIQIAQARRAEYLRIIASDNDLFAQSQRWAQLSRQEQEHFLRTVFNRADAKFGSGKNLNISFRNMSDATGFTDYMNNGNIVISMNDYAPLGLKPSKNLDDAMHILAHEHSHSILLNTPSKSSISEDLVGTIIAHNEDLGQGGRGIINFLDEGEITLSNSNYSKLLQEQEGKLIGQEVGNGFSTELRKVRQSYTPSSSGATTGAATGTRTGTTAGRSASTAAAAETRKAEYVAPTSSRVGPTQEVGMAARRAGLDIIDPNTLSDKDLAYYILYEKYAPRNEKFERFLEDWGHMTPEQLSDYAKRNNWVSWEDVERITILQEQRVNFLMDKPDAMKLWQSLPADSKISERNALVAKQYPEYKSIVDEMESLQARGVPDPAQGRGFNGNYTTFDMPLSKQTKTGGAEVLADAQAVNDKKKELQTMVGNGEISQSKANEELKEFEKNTLVDTKAKITRSLGSPENLDERTVRYIDQMNRIIDGDSQLSFYKNNFANLSDEEKRLFAHSLITRMERANGVSSEMITPTTRITTEVDEAGVTPRRYLMADKNGNLSWTNGNYYPADKTIVGAQVDLLINPNDLKSYDKFIADLAHETSHALDYANPNATAMGAQRLDIGTKSTVYSSYTKKYNLGDEGDKLYRMGQTEQISYRVNDVLDVTNNPFQSASDLITNPEYLKKLREGNASLTLTNPTGSFQYHFDEVKEMLRKDDIYIRRVPGEKNTYILENINNVNNPFSDTDSVFDTVSRGHHILYDGPRDSWGVKISSEIVDNAGNTLKIKIPESRIRGWLRDGMGKYKFYGDDTYLIDAHFDDIKKTLNADRFDITRGADDTFVVEALK